MGQILTRYISESCAVGTLVSCLIGAILRVPLGHVLWICGPLAVALSLAFMQLTGTIHPPGAVKYYQWTVNAVDITITSTTSLAPEGNCRS